MTTYADALTVAAEAEATHDAARRARERVAARRYSGVGRCPGCGGWRAEGRRCVVCTVLAASVPGEVGVCSS